MKFDVIVGNPPYQNMNQNASSGKLWPRFIIMSLDLIRKNGFVALITPNSWTKGRVAPNGSGRILKRFQEMNTITINNNDCSEYFPGIGVRFSWFVVQNCSPQGRTTLIQNGRTTEIDLVDVFSIPVKIDFLSITQKVFRSSDEFIESTLITNTRNHLMEFVSSDGEVTTVVSNGKFLKTHHSIFDMKNKIIVPWAADLKLTVRGEYVAGDSCLIFEMKESIWSIIRSKLFRFCCVAVKTSFHNEGARYFPKIDMNRIWTDHELYEHFMLTAEEIMVVENTV